MKTLYTDQCSGHRRRPQRPRHLPRRPPRHPGPDAEGARRQGEATNPEQLFAAGYAACFHSALKLVAAKAGADTTDSEVVADVSLGALPTGGFGLAAQIEVSLPELDRETAEALVAQAHQVCPYSNATRGNMQVTLAVA